jgi:hypothetical protein
MKIVKEERPLLHGALEEMERHLLGTHWPSQVIWRPHVLGALTDGDNEAKKHNRCPLF